jgi:two-component system LytT family response regulator
MIRVALIDDEKDARFLLKNQLEMHFEGALEVVGEAQDVNSGKKLLADLKPDLVFLDINMPDGTGFDLLSELDSYPFEVIFVTAYDEFALRAFEFSAFGYLTKPLHTDQLKATILNFLEKKDTVDDGNERVKILMDNYSQDGSVKKLVLPNNKGFEVCSVNEITRIEGDRNYSNFHLVSGEKYTSSKTLGQYESLLVDYGFFRIHQSTIINMSFVKGFRKGSGGVVELSDGSKHKVSRYRKDEFLDKFLG